MQMDLVDESVEAFLMACTKVNEGLDCLIGVGRDVLALGALEHTEHVVGEGGEVSDTVVDVCGFVDADKRLVENCEEVAEELERNGLRDGKLWMSVSERRAEKWIQQLTSSMTLSIIALSRCLVYSLRSCLRYAKVWAPCFISSSTYQS